MPGIEIQPMTRNAFLVRGALAVGAAYGAGAVGPYVTHALGSVGSDDIDAFGFALTLEQVEAAFYKAALGKAALSLELKDVLTEFGDHENQHVDTIQNLIEQLGSKAADPPKTKFDIGDEKAMLKLAVELEDTGVAAYSGLAPLIKSTDLLEAVGSIVQVEARHSAGLRLLAGQEPAPAAFDKPLSPPEVGPLVQRFLTT
jgi:rubrerythrin